MGSSELKYRKLPPVWVVKAIEVFRHFLLRIHRSTFPANVVLYEQIQSLWLAKAISVAAELGIADHIKAAGPLKTSELARLTKTNEDGLYRLMRALSGEGIFREQSQGVFGHSSLSRALESGKGSMKNMIIHHYGKLNWAMLGELRQSVANGNSAGKDILGMEIFEFLRNNPEEAAIFNHSMNDLSDIAIDPVLNAYSFKPFRHIVDVGGGKGMLLSAILFHYPHCKGTLFDLLTAVDEAPSFFGKYGVTDRASVITGSFFESMQEGADCYILKNVIHDFRDAEAILILRKIASAMAAGARVLLIETVVPGMNKPSFSRLLDIQMLVSFSGARERTVKEYSDLAIRSGLKLNRVIPTIAPLNILELIATP